MSRNPQAKPAPKFHEDASVRLNLVEGVELKLTPQNRLFVLYQNRIAWPYLNGETVRYDVSNFTLPEPAIEAIRKVLLKQKEIREKHKLDFDEDESAYTFS